jgi:hypothetical protein
MGLAMTLCCQLSFAYEASVVDIASVKKSSLTNQQKAEKMALLGERLLTPVSMPYAVNAFNDALQLDPKNARAVFYTNMLRPYVALKGIFSRVTPLLRSTNQSLVYEEYGRFISEMGNSPTARYFDYGPYDIKTDADLQGALRSLNQAWENTRIFLMYNKKPIWLTNALAAGHNSDDLLKTAMQRCQASEVKADVYSLGKCPYVNYHRYYADYGDLEALSQVSTGQVIANIMVTAYNLPGMSEVIAREVGLELQRDKASDKYNNGKMSQQAYIRIANMSLSDRDLFGILTRRGAGRLLPDNNINLIENMGVESFGGFKWLARMQRQLCPQGTLDSNSRPQYLFSSGICLSDVLGLPGERGLRVLLSQIQTTLAGGPIQVASQFKRTNINLSRIYKQPVADISALFPRQFNRKGDTTQFPDNTMGGVFINNDASQFLGVGGN